MRGGQATISSDQPAFVTREGAELRLYGQPYRFAGCNIYWLGILENNSASGTGIHYPSHAEIDAVLDDAHSMGANVVRSHACLSVGSTLTIQPTLGSFNSTAFETVDYALAAARRRGIRFVFPLVDNNDYYNGGKFTYVNWRSITPDAVASQFYTDSTVRSDFKAHITAVLNHVNQYTGIAYKQDPTVLAWETGNEMSVYPSSWTHSSWTGDIADHIKVTLGARQLVLDGKYGVYSSSTIVDTASLQLANVDIYSTHSYDDFRTPSDILNENSAARSYNKAFALTEYTWTGSGGGTALSWTLGQMLSTIESGAVAGDLYWSLFANGINHGDGYTLHWPGDTSDMITRAGQLKTHALAMHPPL